MGIGDHSCGEGPCGFDPSPSTSVRVVGTNAIPYYDPEIRGFALATTGDLVSVHPVIQQASFFLGVALGSIPAAPDVGLNIKRIKAARSEDILVVCRDEVNIALARPIAAGDVRVVEVRAEAKGGRVGMEVDIMNLRDRTSPKAITLIGAV